MSALLLVVVQLLARWVPTVAANQPLIDDIISTLAKLLPEAIKTAQDLVPEIKNIIAALQGTDGITPEQWAALDALQKQADADFDQAAKDEGFPAPDPSAS